MSPSEADSLNERVDEDIYGDTNSKLPKNKKSKDMTDVDFNYSLTMKSKNNKSFKPPQGQSSRPSEQSEIDFDLTKTQYGDKTIGLTGKHVSFAKDNRTSSAELDQERLSQP